MGNYKAQGLIEAEKIRKKYNLTVIGSVSNGYLQPKTYIFAESEEQVAKLIESEPKEEVPPEEIKEENTGGFTLFKRRGRPRSK
jgi:hypothetical protein